MRAKGNLQQISVRGRLKALPCAPNRAKSKSVTSSSWVAYAWEYIPLQSSKFSPRARMHIRTPAQVAYIQICRLRLHMVILPPRAFSSLTHQRDAGTHDGTEWRPTTRYLPLPLPRRRSPPNGLREQPIRNRPGSDSESGWPGPAWRPSRSVHVEQGASLHSSSSTSLASSGTSSFARPCRNSRHSASISEHEERAA
jgi:hypothetical protein